VGIAIVLKSSSASDLPPPGEPIDTTLYDGTGNSETDGGQPEDGGLDGGDGGGAITCGGIDCPPPGVCCIQGKGPVTCCN
jgi:hypothetical protein